MHKVLKYITLTSFSCMSLCLLVSCDEEAQASFDYKYDGLTSKSSIELDLAQAKKIQRAGMIETVELSDASVEPEPVPMEMPEEEPEEVITDPNFM